MAKLPPPRRPLPSPRPSELRELPTDTPLYRVYRAAGQHPVTWRSFRHVGPVANARFDPQTEPAREQEWGVLYWAGSLPTALAEAFGDARVIERRRRSPWLAGCATVRPLRLLDLGGSWPTRAGASQAISSGRRDTARLWAQAIYEEHDVDGLLYPSAMSGRRRAAGDPPLHGLSVALWERAADALPDHPLLHMPLWHPGLDTALGAIADRYGYQLLD